MVVQYGYDENSRKAYKIHQACKRALRKTNNIGLSEDDIYSMINDLSENHGI